MAKLVQSDSAIIVKQLTIQYPEGAITYAQAHTKDNKTERIVCTEITIEDEEVLLDAALQYAKMLGVNTGKALFEQINILSRNAANSVAQKGATTAKSNEKVDKLIKMFQGAPHNMDLEKATYTAYRALSITRITRNGKGGGNSEVFLNTKTEDIKALFGKKD
jgi:hypothetical protein